MVGFFLFLILGLLQGSFATAILYREKNNQSWIWNKADSNKARSFCPNCKHILGVKDLIPFFSYVFQKGKCRYCKTKISSSYILIESFSVLISLVIWSFLGVTFASLLMMFALPFLLAQSILLLKYKKSSPLLLSILAVFAIIIFQIY